MVTEWVLGIAASAIVAVSGIVLVGKKVKIKPPEAQARIIEQDFVEPFLPGAVHFYRMHAAGSAPQPSGEIEQLAFAIHHQSQTAGYEAFDRHRALEFIRTFPVKERCDIHNLPEFFFWYLNYTIGILRNLANSPADQLKELELVQKQYALWHICAEELSEDAPDATVELLHLSSYYEKDLTEIDIGIFREMMEDVEVRKDRRRNLVRIVFQALEKRADDAQEITAVKQFQQHYNKRYTHRHREDIHF